MKMAPGEAYCVKCRTGKQIQNRVFARYKNNMPVEKGTCVDCGTKLTRMLNKQEALQYELLNAEGSPD